MYRRRLDERDSFPAGMEEYLGQNGWHFNKRMCEWAVSRMRSSNGINPFTKEQTEELLNRCSVNLECNEGYDSTYVMNMARFDYWGSSISDEQHLAKFVKDYQDDKDGYDGKAFTRFYADCIGCGTPIPWEDVL